MNRYSNFAKPELASGTQNATNPDKMMPKPPVERVEVTGLVDFLSSDI
jgi:hypothetical protein